MGQGEASVGTLQPNADIVGREDDGCLAKHLLSPHPAIGRASAAFVSEFVRDASAVCGGNIVDTVLCMALLEGNLRDVPIDGGASCRSSATGPNGPGDLRRPSSIHSIATSLALPFETVRRRIRGLAERGLCVFVPGGVVLDDTQFARQDVLALIDKIHAGVRALYAVTTQHSPTFDPLARDGEGLDLVPDEAAGWIVSRAALSYLLRYLESAERVAGSLLDGAIFMAVFNHNVAGYVARARAPGAPAMGADILDDDLRDRIPAFAVARAMGLSAETVRRRISILLARGLLVRDDRGVYVPGAVLASPPVRAHRDRNIASLQRLFGDLQRAGLRFARSQAG